MAAGEKGSAGKKSGLGRMPLQASHSGPVKADLSGAEVAAAACARVADLALDGEAGIAGWGRAMVRDAGLSERPWSGGICGGGTSRAWAGPRASADAGGGTGEEMTG